MPRRRRNPNRRSPKPQQKSPQSEKKNPKLSFGIKFSYSEMSVLPRNSKKVLENSWKILGNFIEICSILGKF